MEQIFKRLIWCAVVVLATNAIAQEPVSKEYDEEMKQLIEKVESKDDVPAYSNKYQPKSELERKANERLEQYCLALANESWRTLYNMMTKPYRDAVTFSEFVGQKRLTLYRTLIDEVDFKDESCAFAQGYYWGEQGGSGLDSLRIPLRIYLLLEEGEWRVFKNPYENSMGITLPKARKFKIPCEF